MNASQLEQLKSMSPAARTSHYLRKLISKEITREQYDSILKVVLEIPYIPIVSQDGEVVTGHGEAIQTVEQEADRILDKGSEGRREAEPTPSKDTQCTPMEWVNSLSLPLDKHEGEKRKRLSQKDKIFNLLQDGRWYDTPSIQIAVYGANHCGSAAIPTRVSELNNPVKIIESRAKAGSIWEYRMIPSDENIKWVASNMASG
tara:strand:- start:284 stop:889 length:606 start_codon:yes stop_codon:yes gene_type:complete